MLNGRAAAFTGGGAEDVCDCVPTARSPSLGCKSESFGSPKVRAFAVQQLRPKIKSGFDIGQRRRALLCVGFMYCLRRQKRALSHATVCQREPLGSHEMEQSTKLGSGGAWRKYLPPLNWLAHYQAAWLTSDFVAGVTLAAYAIPVALAYATLAGLPPQIGIYGYMLGGIGYALLGSSRQLAVGPTSAISLMIAAAVGPLAAGDEVRYAQVASVAAFAVALLCLIAWLFRLNMLVRLISDSILVGFKAGAGLTIVMTQLPSLFGVAGGGHNFFERAALLAGELGVINYLVFALGVVAILLLVLGERIFPARPVGLA